MAGNNPIGFIPRFFLHDDFYNCRFYCKYCQGKYKFAIVVTIFKNVKGKVLSDF